MSERDTICALASGQPPAAICIIRLSGDRIWKLAGALLDCGLPEPRHATLTKFRDEDGNLIDEGLVVFMPGPHSYTGEDTLELYLHGGPAVITHAISTLTSEPGVRLAEPGEFTRRAFEAGKIDLTEAEGVADIIEAETNAQKAQALRQLTGGLTEQYDQWRADLTGILALIEVVVDFPDEEDAPEETTAPVIRKLTRLIHEIEEALNDLAATDMSSGGWLTKFKSFEHQYRHHIDEEEEDHFPDFERHLDEDDMKHMERVFERRKTEEKAEAEVTPEKKEDAKE